ncbi:hypothetical protein PHSY_004083 [Pseudozyma hubeiensis SY62]|uniref:SUN domain-containing protein n=1 Tax=Pseudozyma hubeiensis (strain SY62) TaxID=1305764 RepID=R9P4Y5_PSEHS|nr:hypothetical protein PHSY_004083 [Pseudozyma hubeiensis SY62]GAC96503.1 hypothetical protein PHSY_004083 [Pseudozyma hubeiensis SY62]
MSSRTSGPAAARRRSPRILGRSETPEVRNAIMNASTPSRRALSPEAIEQLTPSASSRTRMHTTIANGSTSMSIKQEDASTSYYVREPSNQPRLTSPPVYQSALLRGDQRSFNDPRDASASMSIFSSEGDLTDSYQREESEVARMQNQQQQHRPASRITAARRASGQRRPRTSADNLAYRPASDDDDDDDDDDEGGSPTRRTRKGRNSNSFGAIDQGRIDNLRWKNSTAKSKKKRCRKAVNGIPADADASMETNADEDAEAASGKETRFDGASESEDADDLEEEEEDRQGERGRIRAAGRDKEHGSTKQPASRSRVSKRGPLSFVGRFLLAAVTWLIKLPAFFWNQFLALGPALRFAIAALLLAATAVHLLRILGLSGDISGRSPSFTDDDIPGANSNSRALTLSLDRENQRLRAELNRLSARFDTLSTSIDAQISSSLSSAAAKIQADAETRQSSELNRITASTKRTVSRLAQDELKSIQDSVSASVELMLRDLDKKINVQLKQRADDTEGKFFSKLESEVSRIAKYANDEVNARLGQAFDKTFLNSLIDDKLEKYSRDRTDKVDYASVTSGAWISVEGTVHRGYRLNSVWNLGQFLAQGRKVPIGDPVKAITPGSELGVGNCWITGWDSWLQVELRETKVVEGLAVEHPLPGMVRSAPRRMVVWGLVDDGDREYVAQFRRSKGQTSKEYLDAVLPKGWREAVPKEYEKEAPLILAVGAFNASGSTLQELELTEEARAYPYGVKAVRWQFVDGWSKHPPICVHRVRVHGRDWPVFGATAE